MLSESEVGLKGLRALFEFYKIYARAGLDAEELAREQGFTLERLNIDTFAGEVFYQVNHIIVSMGAWRALRDFVICHELGHTWLWKTDPIFLPPDFASPKMDRGQRRELEYWLDGFATAMLFASRGVKLLSEENYQDFFIFGCTISLLEGADWRFDIRKDKTQGKRMCELAKKYFLRNGPSRAELVTLGGALLERVPAKND